VVCVFGVFSVVVWCALVAGGVFRVPDLCVVPYLVCAQYYHCVDRKPPPHLAVILSLNFNCLISSVTEEDCGAESFGTLTYFDGLV
jgi:hypothetical protein